MPRRVSLSTVVLAVMALAVVIGGIMIYGLLNGWGAESESGQQPSDTSISGSSASPSPAAVMPKDEAKELEDGLVSNYRPVLNKVLADGYKPPLAESGTTVVIDRGSLRQYKSAGQVNATVTEPGEKPAKVRLYLSKDGSDWRVCAVREVK